jgi:integrase
MGRVKLIHKRPGSQNYYARLMVPKQLREAIGKREFTMSLGTPDRREAEARALPVLGEWREELRVVQSRAANDDPIAQAGVKHRPTKAEIEDAALWVGFDEASRKLDALITAKARLGPDTFAQVKSEFERRYLDVCRRQFAGEDGFWTERAIKMVNHRQWDLSEGSPEFAFLIEQLSLCGLDLFRKAVETLRNPVAPFQPSEHTRSLSTKRQERAKEGEGIMDLFDVYAAQRRSEGKKGADTLRQDRVAISSFVELIGSDRSLRSVKPTEVREWRNAMAAVPVGYRKRKDFSGLSLRQAVEVAAKVGAQKPSLLTVNKNLSGLSSFFVWAKREGYAESNPCDGLRYDADKRKNPRPPFTVDQLNAMLTSPLFVGFAEDGQEHIRGNVKTRDWRFWIPLVCLFTGARIGEIAQLRVDDVECHEGHWFIHIRHSERTGQRTKNGKSRIAPMHSILEKIGFVGFAQDQQKRALGSGDQRLFPELMLNEREQHGRASRFWRTYLARIGVKEGADGHGTHSFRHGMADQLRLAGYHDSEIAVVLGHQQASVTSGYGTLRQGTAARLSEIINSAKFEGVAFSHLYLSRE